MAYRYRRQILRCITPLIIVSLVVLIWALQRTIPIRTPIPDDARRSHTALANGGVSRLPWRPFKKVLDVCSRKSFTCVPGESGKIGFAVYISNSSGYAVPKRGRDLDDTLTYFDYIYALVGKLVSVTSLPVVILVTPEVVESHRTQWVAISPGQVEVREILTAYTLIGELEATRKYHYFSFGKLEVLNPRWVGDFFKLAVLDPDTFVLKCVDEVFCLPGKFAAVRRAHALSSHFNAGFMVVSPHRDDYNNIMKLLRVRAKKEKIFGDQPLFNQYFFSQMSCLANEYNCGGFGDSTGLGSLKCGIPEGSDENYVRKKRSVLHLKLSQRKSFSLMPTIATEWMLYLPVDSQLLAKRRILASNLSRLPEHS